MHRGCSGLVLYYGVFQLPFCFPFLMDPLSLSPHYIIYISLVCTAQSIDLKQFEKERMKKNNHNMSKGDE